MIRYYHVILFGLAISLFASCNRQQTDNSSLFEPVKADFTTQTLKLPKGYTHHLLFSEGDTVTNADKQLVPAKGKHDLNLYIPINNSSEHGYIYTSHETHAPNTQLGDGGGATISEVEKVNNEWRIRGNKRAVDFSAVGETIRNCGGTVTPHGTVLTAEESAPENNTKLLTEEGITDTTELNGRSKHYNYGWMVEVDIATGKALRKLWHMGRYSHEDAHCMPDGKTVYLTSDETPAVFYKFIADKANDYSQGQLYAYKQGNNNTQGSWIKLPMEMDSLLHISDVAIRMGATMFVRHEWIDGDGDMLYITETGNDEFNLQKHIDMGGSVAHHLKACSKDGFNYNDYYGRLLAFDLKTNEMKVWVNGGVSTTDSTFCFSNPDALTIANIKNKKYLVISEDSNGKGMGRVSHSAFMKGELYNEIYFLPLDNHNPKLEDLQRFAMGPRGCETTGNAFTPDGESYFVSIQSPDSRNPTPFNKSCIVAIQLATDSKQ